MKPRGTPLLCFPACSRIPARRREVRRRLDTEMVRRGLARSRSDATESIERGGVLVAGRPIVKPATLVAPDEPITVAGAPVNLECGVCGTSGAKVGTATCWFNPGAFALPPPGQFGTAGRNILRGPGFAQLDLALQKGFQVREGTKIVLRAETFNLLNHPNFAVPSNTQSPLTLGGNGDAVFKDAAGHFANNVGKIFSTVDSARQIQLGVRFLF